MPSDQKPLTSRQLQAKATRERIFDTATLLINQKGYDNVTIDDICGQCAVAKGLFYHYFKSKAGIISASEELMISRFQDSVNEIPVRELRDYIFDICRCMFQTAERGGLEITRRHYVYIFSQNQKTQALSDSLALRASDLIREAMEDAQGKNVLSADAPIATITNIYHEIFTGFFFDWSSNGQEHLWNDATASTLQILTTSLLNAYMKL